MNAVREVEADKKKLCLILCVLMAGSSGTFVLGRYSPLNGQGSEQARADEAVCKQKAADSISNVESFVAGATLVGIPATTEKHQAQQVRSSSSA